MYNDISRAASFVYAKGYAAAVNLISHIEKLKDNKTTKEYGERYGNKRILR